MMQIWNPWHGCRKYSEGCEHCYMYYLDAQHDRDGSEIYKTKTNFNLPLKKTKQGHYKIPSGTLLHVCMTSDFFLEDADDWRNEVWDMIQQRPDVTFWIQTKRAKRIAEHLPEDWDNGWENVILCVTTENQKRVDERLPILLSIPAKHKAFMCAPILSEIHVEQYLATGQFEKVLADGENYDGTRPCRYEWIKSLHDQCENANVEFDFIGTGNILSKMAKHIAFRKRIRGCRHSVRDLVIHQEIRIFQCSRNAGSAKEKTVATAVIGVENADKGE